MDPCLWSLDTEQLRKVARQYPSVLTTPVHTTADMWRFLTGNGNNNINQNNSGDSTDSGISDSSNNSGDSLGSHDMHGSSESASPSSSLSLCLCLSVEEARTFVRHGNLGYLKVR